MPSPPVSPPQTQPMLTPTAPVGRPRGESSVSLMSTASTTAESPTSVSSKRQSELERYFGADLKAQWNEPTPIPLDYLTVIATQSGDLQAKLLLHGRLYLTPYHLCFRSNILGYKTETIHPLKKLRSVKKGTTAKWIQNAVYIIEDDHEGEEYIGYGSLADRNAMFDSIRDCWKVVSPEKYEAWLARGSSEQLVNGTNEEKDVDEEGGAVVASSGEDAVVKGTVAAKTTQCTGEDHLDELAIDTVVGIPLDQLYQLVYQNRDFIEDFYKNDKGLTDLKISEWEKSAEGDKRSLTYVMHMNNSIGPSKSDCIGSETIVVTDPSKCYEILSETQTPGLPSGKKFKIHTRTCLTSAEIKGKPAARMYCTTQCDWSSGSWLKSTITPAVIKGQKEHHQQLVGKIRKHIKAHPADFGVTEGDEESDTETITEKETVGVESKSSNQDVMTLGRYAKEKPQELAALGIVGLLALLVIGMLYQMTQEPRVVVVRT